MGFGSILGGLAGGLTGIPGGSAIGASLGGLIEGQNAIKDAQGNLVAANQQQIAMYNQQQAEAKRNLTPFINNGTAASNRIGALLGIAPQYNARNNAVSMKDDTKYWNGHADKATDYYIDANGNLTTKANGKRVFSSTRNYNLNTLNADFQANRTAGDVGDQYGSLLDTFGADDFQDDPGYAFRLQQGEQALGRANAARGNFLSGSAIKGAIDFNSGLASQEFGNAFARDTTNKQNTFGMLTGVANSGQSAAGTLGSLGANYAQNVGGAYGAIGNAQAAGGIATMNLGNQTGANMASKFGSMFGNYQAQQPIMWDQPGYMYGRKM
jgi:hypothetical protein